MLVRCYQSLSTSLSMYDEIIIMMTIMSIMIIMIICVWLKSVYNAVIIMTIIIIRVQYDTQCQKVTKLWTFSINGRQLEVWARRASRLLVLTYIVFIAFQLDLGGVLDMGGPLWLSLLVNAGRSAHPPIGASSSTNLATLSKRGTRRSNQFSPGLNFPYTRPN